MAVRRPLYLGGGFIAEIPDGDVLPLSTTSPDFNYLTVGQSSIARSSLASQSATSLAGSLHLTYFTGRKSETSTQVKVPTGSTAATATPTLAEISLFTVDGSGNGTRVAITASDTSLFAAGATAYTRSWLSSYAMVAGQRYALGILLVSAAAAPTFLGFLSLGSVMLSEFTAAPRITGRLASQTSTPTTFLDSALGTHASAHYGVILP